jgi:hypothetical protein
MKKTILILLFILGMNSISNGQTTIESYNDPVGKLNGKFNNIVIKNLIATSESEIMEEQIDNHDTVYVLKGLNYTFEFTDKKWNHLEIYISEDEYHVFNYSGRFNGRSFITDPETGDIIYEDNKKTINAWFKVD